MSNTLSTLANSETGRLLKEAGFRIISKGQREAVIARIDGKDHLGTVESEYVVEKEKKKYVVFSGADPTDPEIRAKLIEADRAFGLAGVALVDCEKRKIQLVRFRYPRERGLDYYFQLFSALFIVAFVIGIIWLLIAVKLF